MAMQNILVLLDFTETADHALYQATELAALKNSKLILSHIFSQKLDDAEMKAQMKQYTNQLDGAGVNYELALASGDFYSEVINLCERIRPDLVIVGTHGKKGLKQNLLGSNIYKLVSKIKGNTLVFGDGFAVKKGGFKRILSPVSAHADFLKKIDGAIDVMAEGGEIMLFDLRKPGVGVSEKILKNINTTKVHLDAKGVHWTYLEIDAEKFSVGYSKETLSLVKDQNADLISIIVDVSNEGLAFGKLDKENIILNQEGAAVLCING